MQQVLNFIRYSKDKHKLKELMEQDPKYGELDEEAFDVASAYAGAEELIAYKEWYCEEGVVNMCQAIREMMEDSRAEGEIKGEIKTYIHLVGDGLYTLEQAADKMGMTLEEFKRKAEEFGLM